MGRPGGNPNIKEIGAWKPGESGNPAGKPKGTLNRKTLLQKWTTVASANGTVEDDIALALIKQANKGDVAAIKEIFDGLHGKIVEKSEIAVTAIPESRSSLVDRFLSRRQK